MDRGTYFVAVLLALLSLTGTAWAQNQSDTPTLSDENETQQSDTAEEGASDTPALDTSDTQLQFNVGYKQYQRGNLEQALSRLKLAFRGDTTSDRIRFWLGRMYYVNGQNDSALEVWNNHDPESDYADWFERELIMHKRRYGQHEFSLNDEWTFVGIIPGKVSGSNRLTNPTAIEKGPGGGWYASSYQLNKVIQYSTEGRVLDIHRGLDQPVDLHYDPSEGLYVINGGNGGIQRLTDTGSLVPWMEEEISGAQKLLSVGNRKYLFDYGQGRIIQLSNQGETVVTVWNGGPQRNINDVSIGPDNRFWVLDRSGPEILVINRYGDLQKTVGVSHQLNLNRIWWKKGHLFAAGDEDFVELDPETGQGSEFEYTQGTIKGSDVTDILITGDHVILTLFQESSLAIYRMTEPSNSDLLFQDRRANFSKFPVIRMNMILEDPFNSGRFKHFSDDNIGFYVNGREVLPSLFRHSGDVYTPGWIMIMDNRMESQRRWNEIRPKLLDLITNSPDRTQGSIWQVGDQSIAQGFSDYKVQLRNSLRQIEINSSNTDSDTGLFNVLEDALDASFGRMGPTGIILVSHNIENDTRFRRLAQRLRNNKIPLIIVNPSVDTVAPNHPIREITPSLYSDFNGMNLNQSWDFYNKTLRSHYTAIFKSNLGFMRSNRNRPYSVSFHFFDRTFEHSGAYAFP